MAFGTSTTAPAWIPADTIYRFGFAKAAEIIEHALLTHGIDESHSPRGVVELRHGQFLLMPAEDADYAGVKVTTVAPENPKLGRERIQGIYLLVDAPTLTPLAALEGAALTTLRTPAMSMAVLAYLANPVIEHVVVLGYGPQAQAHVSALRCIRKPSLVTVVARNTAHAQSFAQQLEHSGLPATVGAPTDVRDADVILCATTSRMPLFDGRLVADHACVVAVGSHEPDVRELDSGLIARAQVVVEDVATAVREAGDVAIPIHEGSLQADRLVPARAIVQGRIPVAGDRPRVFKSVGMPWEDLVIASAIYQSAQRCARSSLTG